MSVDIRWIDENKNIKNTTVATPSDIPTPVMYLGYSMFDFTLRNSDGFIDLTNSTYSAFYSAILTNFGKNHMDVAIRISARIIRATMISPSAISFSIGANQGLLTFGPSSIILSDVITSGMNTGDTGLIIVEYSPA